MPARFATLSLDDWPAADRAAWNALYAPSGLFEDSGAAAHQRPATRDMMQDSYGRWLMWLRQEGTLLETEDPTSRITPDRVRAFIMHMTATLKPGTMAMTIQHLDQLARWFAPGDDWTWLRAWKQKLWRRYRAPDKRARLVPARALLDLGIDLMNEMRNSQDQYPVKWRTRYRDGLMISLLILCPFRLANFSTIHIGEHLQVAGSGYRLAFAPTETKSHAPDIKPVPAELLPYLMFYLEEVRPYLLMDTRHDRLWVTKDGMPMPDGAVAKQIKHWTRKRLGRAINPHLFRDCAATDAALLLPGSTGIARSVLGHGSLRTTESYYIAANQVHAARAYHDTLKTLKGSKR